MQGPTIPNFQRYTIGFPSNRSSIGDPSFNVRSMLGQFQWRPEHNFCELVIGSGLESVATGSQVMSFINSMSLVPNLAGFVVSAYDDIWVPNWEQQIRQRLSEVNILIFRVVSTISPLEITTSDYDLPGQPHSVSTLAKLPVDGVDYSTVSRILNNPSGRIQVLHLLPPATHLRDPAGSYQRQLVQALLQNGSFEKVIIPFALLDDSQSIFVALQGPRRLRSLEVTPPETPSDFNLTYDFKTLIDLTKGIESLVQLRRLTIPYNLESFDLLQELLQRMFDQRTAHNGITKFYRN